MNVAKENIHSLEIQFKSERMD